MTLLVPIIEDVTGWSLKDIQDAAWEIKITRECKVLAHLGYREVTLEEFMREPLPELPSLEEDV